LRVESGDFDVMTTFSVTMVDVHEGLVTIFHH